MKIRTILFPTDFSANAMHALNYAIQLAKKCNASFILFHSYQLPVIQTDVPIEIMETQIEEKEKEALAKLEELKAFILSVSPNTSSITVLKRGFTVENIISISEDEHIDLIVMGTKGASGLKEVILGSNTADVIAKAECPVFAVPENAKISDINKIVYAVDPDHLNCNATVSIIKFAMNFEAEIDLLSISENDDQELIKEQLESYVDQIFYDKSKIAVIQDKSIINGINSYNSKHQPDLLIMETHKKNMFEKLFKGSLTEKMSFHTDLPLMAFHSK